VFWIAVATISLLFGTWPYFIDLLGTALEVAYPPTLLLLAAVIVLILKALFGDIALTKVRRDLRRLNQRIALIEASRADPVAGAPTREVEEPKPSRQSRFS
jgi:hypothetical protein